jgi:hypothetical protein
MAVFVLQADFHESRLESWLGSSLGSSGHSDYCYVCIPSANDTEVREADDPHAILSRMAGSGYPDCPGPDQRSMLETGYSKAIYVCKETHVLYAASVYWSIATITSIGYGDIGATPGNATELFITALLMLLSGFVWADVIGAFVTVLSNVNPDKTQFRANSTSAETPNVGPSKSRKQRHAHAPHAAPHTHPLRIACRCCSFVACASPRARRRVSAAVRSRTLRVVTFPRMGVTLRACQWTPSTAL